MSPYQLPEAISFNFDELKAGLLEKTKVYEAMVYTDEQISAAKADRANLNRLKKALNDERLKREREYMQPFTQFKAQIAEIISIIDRPVQVIDKQVKAFEEQQKAEKLEKIKEYFEAGFLFGEPASKLIAFERIHDPRWLNASVSMKSIQEAIDSKLEKAAEDLAVIRALSSYAFEAEQAYLSSLDLAKAVSEAHRLSEIAERKAAHEAEKARKQAEATPPDFTNLKPGDRITFASPPYTVVEDLPTQPKKHCLDFRVWLTVEQARELKEFFQSRNIEFEKIRKDGKQP